MFACNPEKFASLYETELGQRIWAFLTAPENIARLEAASQLSNPAVERIKEYLLEEFREDVLADRVELSSVAEIESTSFAPPVHPRMLVVSPDSSFWVAGLGATSPRRLLGMSVLMTAIGQRNLGLRLRLLASQCSCVEPPHPAAAVRSATDDMRPEADIEWLCLLSRSSRLKGW